MGQESESTTVSGGSHEDRGALLELVKGIA